MKKKILEYVITFLIGAVFTLVLLIAKGCFTETDVKTVLQYWVDSLFTSGVILLCFGMIVFISEGGGFDFLFYGVYRFITMFKNRPNDIKYRTYYDYHVARADREKRQFDYLLVVGAVITAVSLIVLYFWYQIPVTTA